MAFSIQELELNPNADRTAEQIRTRQIFEVLKIKTIAEEFLTEHEKDFFYMGVKYSFLNDGKIEDYNCCDNPKFKFLYLIYARDIYGFKKSKITKPGRGVEYIVKNKEKNNDLFYLRIKIEEWKSIVRTTVHDEELLHQSTKETREEIKELKKLSKYKNNIQGIYTSNYITKENAIILHSKWIYCVSLEIFESLDSADFISELNGIEIEFNEFSLIHILNRHFAKILKQFDTKKSFHKEMFIPRILSTQIKEIITIIDTSMLLIGKEINKIAFQIHEQDYIIYTSEKIRGANTYRRLNTFFPVDDKNDKNALTADYNLKVINPIYSVYVPK
ncbi:hypothetical protein SAMN05444395_1263 [Flavobacterium fryxellicola]|uniref:Uncharacterized protein n=1 Tax=Flavobacterium fryxellicola TaxID=249352 RepID=A0A167V2G1_9FLAO|nr:hypothetical protein [Flavobacterium fryxellicola]OAB26018.1 hypothetical protein FBFR_13490 [Flavobacterium fryxellicola]SHN80394.1 hypothetical protein SAMN05444395_1263 [Flavobacterium fryxellicola]